MNTKGYTNSLLVIISVSLVLGTIYTVRHQYYVHSLSKYQVFTSESYREPLFPKLTQQQVLNLGWAHVDPNTLVGPSSKHRPPKSSYIHYSQSKPKGMIRIGIFGDSFVWGSESAYASDFPTLLQGYFEQAGQSHIQVINFGVSGYGVHQTSLMWEYLGKTYDLDYTIFLPFEFHIKRDLTFNRHLTRYCPIHARYILTGNELVLSPVIGNSRPEACAIYHRLLTPRPYRVYDRHAPLFLRVLLPQGRRFKSNFFYYNHLDQKEEALTTYRILFNRIASEAQHPIVLCDHPDICGLREHVPDNIFFYESQLQPSIPGLYRAPKYHKSALGNELQAQELFSLLSARQPETPALITLASHPIDTNKHVQLSPPLFEYDHIRLGIQGQTIAQFVTQKDGAAAWMFENDMEFKQDAVASLLWLPSLKDIQFIPATFPLISDETVYAAIESDEEVIDIPIGQIETNSTVIGKLRLSCIQWITPVHPSSWKLKCPGNSLKALRLEGLERLKTLRIEVGENRKPLMKLKELGKLQKLKNFIKRTFNMSPKLTLPLMPLTSKVAQLRAKSGSMTLGTNKINQTGTLDLLLEKDQRPLRIPSIPYELTTIPPPLINSSYPYPIR